MGCLRLNHTEETSPLKVEHSEIPITIGVVYNRLEDSEKCRAGAYRYGYQGQFAEKDEETGWNSFELRMYDARIGRFITTDPAGQFYSPYVGMGNNPINATDPTGGVTNPIYSSDGSFRGVDEFGM